MGASGTEEHAVKKKKGRKFAKQTAKEAKEEVVPEAAWADKVLGTKRRS